MLASCLAALAYAPPTLLLRPSHVNVDRAAVRATATAASPTASSEFMLRQLDGGKGSFLLQTWLMAAQTVRANGFSPASEAVGDGAFRMKYLADELPKIVSTAKIIGLCERGSLSFETLEEPHKSMAEQLSRTSLESAISVGKGSAIAFVSRWDDHVSIDACVVNPKFLALGEDAEAALLRHVAATALETGIADVRLCPAYQVRGDDFYADCGFFPDSDASADAKGRVLYYRASGEAAAPAGEAQSEPLPSAASDGAEGQEGDAFGAAPQGFDWGGLY